MSARRSTSFGLMNFLLRTPAFTTTFWRSLKNCLRILATPAEFLPPTTIAVGPVRALSMSGRPSDFAATRSELFLTTWYSPSRQRAGAQLRGVRDGHSREVREDDVVGLVRCVVTSSIRYFSRLSWDRFSGFSICCTRWTRSARRGSARRDGDRLDVVALEGGGLGLADRLDHGLDVLEDLRGREGALADPTPMLHVLSILNSTRPALTALMPAAMSSVTVPLFGLGMRPLGLGRGRSCARSSSPRWSRSRRQSRASPR